MRTKSRKTLKRQCDKLISTLTKQKAKGKCEICHRPGKHAHHIIGRRYMNLRYDSNNLCLLCPDCHINLAHQNPLKFSHEIITIRGVKWYDDLQYKKTELIKIDLEETLERLEKEIE